MKFILIALLISFPGRAAEINADCPGLEKLYPKLERSYNRKAPILVKAGWGNLGEWGSEEFEYFRASILRCREQGFFKKLDPVFLGSDVERKVQEMKKESTQLKDDKRIAKTLEEYGAKVSQLGRNLDEAKAAELKDLKDLIARITGLDDSAYFNRAAALQNRIDAILKSPRKKLPAKEVASLERAVDEAQLAARREDPERFQKCETLNVSYQSLVIESLALGKKSVAEQRVEEMARLSKRKEEVLHEMESVSIQLREANCKKFFKPDTSIR